MRAVTSLDSKIVLLIEDDVAARHLLRTALQAHQFQVTEASNGAVGLVQARVRPPDLVILDLGLPDMDGKTVTRYLREWTYVPIIILSGQRQEADKVAALDAGADDYLTKPYGLEELLARIRVALRHGERVGLKDPEPLFTVGDLRVDRARREVFVKEVKIPLTPTEYNLLAALVRQAGAVVTHHQLLREVWGSNYPRETTYVRMYVKRLRRKIEDDPVHPQYLHSEPGVGYRLKTGNHGSR